MPYWRDCYLAEACQSCVTLACSNGACKRAVAFVTLGEALQGLLECVFLNNRVGGIVEYFVNYPAGEAPAVSEWAREKESEGWDGICASDHLWVGPILYPHVFVAAAEMAVATTRVMIATSFCNNLLRSPVEFALAAIGLQRASKGRFEAGLGAGWARDEIEAIGLPYPNGAMRVSMYVEALKIVKELLQTGQCRFEGGHFHVNISGENRILGCEEPPPLVAAAGGTRSLAEVAPLVDRLEVKANARATRGGRLDFGIMATISEEEVRRKIEQVKSIRPELPLGIFLLVGVGDEKDTQAFNGMLGKSYLGRFFGQPSAVADAIRELLALGIDRVQLTEVLPGSHSLLADHLLGERSGLDSAIQPIGRKGG